MRFLCTIHSFIFFREARFFPLPSRVMVSRGFREYTAARPAQKQMR